MMDKQPKTLTEFCGLDDAALERYLREMSLTNYGPEHVTDVENVRINRTLLREMHRELKAWKEIADLVNTMSVANNTVPIQAGEVTVHGDVMQTESGAWVSAPIGYRVPDAWRHMYRRPK